MWTPVCWVNKFSRCRNMLFSSGWSHFTVINCCNISEAVGDVDAVPEPGIPATVIGWVRSIRRHKTRVFFNLSDGSTPRELQIVCCPTTIRGAIHVGSAVSVKGHFVSSRPGSDRVVSSSTADLLLHGELVANDVRPLDSNLSVDSSESRRVLGTSGSNTPRPDLGLLRSTAGLPWRHRLPEFAAVIRLRARVKNIVHRVMQTLEYLEVDTPIMTTLDCEGTNQVFSVRASNEAAVGSTDHSPATVHLTGSSQLHLEALALGLSKVYTLSPTFRAEASHTRHHLAEFHMLEAESVHLDSVDRLCDEIETVVRGLVREFVDLVSPRTQSISRESEHDEIRILDNTDYSDSCFDLSLVLSSLTGEQNWAKCRSSSVTDLSGVETRCAQLQSVLNKPFVRITYDEAVARLTDQFGPRDTTEDLTKAEERHIIDWFGSGVCPVFVSHFPSTLKPFYCLLLDETRSAAVDLLVPQIGELVGGSVREVDPAVLFARLSSMHCSRLSSFDWYLKLRGHGGSPHGGFGLGFERLLQYLLGVHNIRDVIPFPRVLNKICL
ncbi:hypothetical protein P879_01799 [Paragonimus westermani]|uniref:Aminoacyl-transfer RNA synthetases class-II family profile domain-containing protein n=1 Tax=Paragonimus westermani TaxID=34504 RepID=A0A8T0DMB9_9TREM|nr:hypothetical protein P879_01799 [Paragonimus westermani]